MSDKLVIGCTEPSFFIADVVKMIEKFFNANPIKLCQNEPAALIHWLDQCGAVILAGGKDIHPRTYGYGVLNDYGYSQFDVLRDYRELRIINYCLKKGIPILGICRGHQMLGVYHGMRFIPDLSESIICHQPSAQKISHATIEPMHWVCLMDAAPETFEATDPEASILPGAISADKRYLWTNSFHHQGVWHQPEPDKKEEKEKQPAPWRAQVEVLGIATGPRKRRIVELMRGHKKPWISCQWHPEYDWEDNVASEMILTHFAQIIEKKSKRCRSASTK